MGRIIELLSEKKELPLGGDDSKAYLKNTAAGNLFRLMLVVNPDQPIVQFGALNVVSIMLADMMEEHKDTIVSLQKSFNKIKQLIVADKVTKAKQAGPLKRAYFEDLFTLLTPLTGHPEAYPIKQMVTNFSVNTPQSAVFQRQKIALIGRALLANKDVEINTQDRALIKGYILGFDAMGGITSEVADENVEDIKAHHEATPIDVQPKDVVTKVVNPEKSLDEVKRISAQANAAIATIKAKSTPDITHLGDMLKTNEKAETFHVELTGNDTDVSDVINSKISAFYHQTKLHHGVEVANFATKLMTDSIKHLNTANGYLNFVKGEVDFGIEKIQGGLQLSIKVGKSVARSHQFFYENSFITAPDGRFEVHLDKIQIPAGAQSPGVDGKHVDPTKELLGLNKKIFKDALDLYRAEGVDRITLEANVDVGGYGWFRYGFLPKDARAIKSIADWIRAIGPRIVEALKYDASNEMASFIEKRTHNKTTSTINLINLMSGGDASQVIPQLISRCADEFENTFDTPAKFKDIAKNIAIMNFKDYKIAGTVYSISYKALLSIQALKVNGDNIIPLKLLHLNWSGVLDMKNLDDTYAYLSMKKP